MGLHASRPLALAVRPQRHGVKMVENWKKYDNHKATEHMFLEAMLHSRFTDKCKLLND